MSDLIPISQKPIEFESSEQEETADDQIFIFDKDGTTTALPRRNIFYEQMKYVAQLPKTIWLAGNNRLQLPSGDDMEPITVPLLPAPPLWKRWLNKVRQIINNQHNNNQ